MTNGYYRQLFFLTLIAIGYVVVTLEMSRMEASLGTVEYVNNEKTDSVSDPRSGMMMFTVNDTMSITASHDDLIIESTDDRGLSVLGKSGTEAAIVFGDETDSLRAQIRYVHGTDKFTIYYEGMEKVVDFP